jgi:hypothetical protein
LCYRALRNTAINACFLVSVYLAACELFRITEQPRDAAIVAVQIFQTLFYRFNDVRKSDLLPYSRPLVRVAGELFNIVRNTNATHLQRRRRKAAGYKGMPAIASLAPSPSPLAMAGKVASVGFLGRGRPSPVATPARNVRLSGCTYVCFSQFGEGLRPNLLKVGRVRLLRNEAARGKK